MHFDIDIQRVMMGVEKLWKMLVYKLMDFSASFVHLAVVKYE